MSWGIAVCLYVCLCEKCGDLNGHPTSLSLPIQKVCVCMYCIMCHYYICTHMSVVTFIYICL